MRPDCWRRKLPWRDPRRYTSCGEHLGIKLFLFLLLVLVVLVPVQCLLFLLLSPRQGSENTETQNITSLLSLCCPLVTSCYLPWLMSCELFALRLALTYLYLLFMLQSMMLGVTAWCFHGRLACECSQFCGGWVGVPCLYLVGGGEGMLTFVAYAPIIDATQQMCSLGSVASLKLGLSANNNWGVRTTVRKCRRRIRFLVEFPCHSELQVH